MEVLDVESDCTDLGSSESFDIELLCYHFLLERQVGQTKDEQRLAALFQDFVATPPVSRQS
eukprot:344942-Amphidinium_carterae.3